MWTRTSKTNETCISTTMLLLKPKCTQADVLRKYVLTLALVTCIQYVYTIWCAWYMILKWPVGAGTMKVEYRTSGLHLHSVIHFTDNVILPNRKWDGLNLPSQETEMFDVTQPHWVTRLFWWQYGIQLWINHCNKARLSFDVTGHMRAAEHQCKTHVSSNKK